MPYRAEVYRVFIASPSDVNEERNVITKVIQEWNDLNSAERQVVLLPLRWETHSSPEYGKRPQSVINKQVLDSSDLLIGTFWTRIGSPTGIADSGTIEEITRVSNSGKPIMLYFSKAKASPDDLDLEQLDKLRKFKKQTLSNALIESYDSIIEFRDKLSRQLEIQIRTLMSNGVSTGSVESKANSISLGFKNENDEFVDSINTTSKILNVTDSEDIPDYIDTQADFRGWRGERDTNYYRKRVKSIVLYNKVTPICFSLKNEGIIGARDIYISFLIKSDEPSVIFRKDMLNRRRSFLIDMDTEPENYLELQALQPKRIIAHPDVFEIGADKDCSVEIEATIYADILSEPIIKKLMVNIEVKNLDVSYQTLLDITEDD